MNPRRDALPYVLWTLSTALDSIVSMARERHQRKQVEQALRFAEGEGCEVEVRHAGHTWGHVVAPDGQRLRVWSTPRMPTSPPA